jgi:hypothetical protein
MNRPERCIWEDEYGQCWHMETLCQKCGRLSGFCRQHLALEPAGECPECEWERTRKPDVQSLVIAVAILIALILLFIFAAAGRWS